MKFTQVQLKTLLRRVIVAAGLCVLAACSTTGAFFKTSQLQQIVPGQTTLPQAITILGTAPDATYRQMDGTITARWAYKASFVTDAAYVRKELSLLFGPDGRFVRVVDSVNVFGQTGVAPGAEKVSSPKVQTAPAPAAANPLMDTSIEGVSNTTVTYPLGQ